MYTNYGNCLLMPFWVWSKQRGSHFCFTSFLTGILEIISKQLRASGKVTTLNALITQARLLMTIDSDAGAVLKEKPHKPHEVELLRERVAVLTEQVAALSTSSKGMYTRPPRSHPHYFHCNQVGHVQRDCRNRKRFNCGRLGHLSKDCWHQGNNNGIPVQGNRRPYQ